MGRANSGSGRGNLDCEQYNSASCPLFDDLSVYCLPVHKTAKCGFMSGFTKGRKIVKIADEQVLKSDPLVLRTAQKGAE